jgi:hypothetical protein
VAEREVFELLVDAVQSEPVSDRRVDLDGLARDAATLDRLDRAQGAHVVEPIGKLDQDDAHIARHREQHLAEVLGLRFFLGLELDLVEFGDAVYQLCDGLAEMEGDLGFGDLGVFGHVVEQRGGERLRVHVPLREDVGNGERVRDVRLAGLTELAFVSCLAEVVRRLELSQVLRLEVTGPFLE